MKYLTLCIVFVLAWTSIGTAQAPVVELKDLIGARVRDAEPQLEQRGYALAGTARGIEYWRKDKQCVQMNFANLRVTGIVTATLGACDKAAANKPTAPPPSATGFATMCGVMVDGKPIKYKCTVEGTALGQHGTTVLHFPDNRLDLMWGGGNHVTVTFVGLKPQETTYATADGITRFTLDKEYFFASDRTSAARELKSVR